MISARGGTAQTTAAQSQQPLVDGPAEPGQNLRGTILYLKTTAETLLVTLACGATIVNGLGKNAMFQFVQRLRLRLSANGTRLIPFCRLNSSAQLPSVTMPHQPRTAITSCSTGAVMSSQSTPILLIPARKVCQLKQTQPGRKMPQPLLLRCAEAMARFSTPLGPSVPPESLALILAILQELTGATARDKTYSIIQHSIISAPTLENTLRCLAQAEKRCQNLTPPAIGGRAFH